MVSMCFQCLFDGFNGFMSHRPPEQVCTKKVGQDEQAMLLLQPQGETVTTVIGKVHTTIH